MSRSRAVGSLMRIGELSERTGVPARLLRYYEQQGLLSPKRNASGYRLFTESDVRRVIRVRGLLTVGLGTSAIAKLLVCLDEREAEPTPLCSGVLDALMQHRDQLVAALARLGATAERLDDLITSTHRELIVRGHEAIADPFGDH